MVPAPAARRRRNLNPAARSFPAGGQTVPPPAGPGGGNQPTDKQTERPRGGDPPVATPREGAHPAGGPNQAPTTTSPGRDQTPPGASRATGGGDPRKPTPIANAAGFLFSPERRPHGAAEHGQATDSGGQGGGPPTQARHAAPNGRRPKNSNV